MNEQTETSSFGRGDSPNTRGVKTVHLSEEMASKLEELIGIEFDPDYDYRFDVNRGWPRGEDQ